MNRVGAVSIALATARAPIPDRIEWLLANWF
jgi:hypothetical protein